MKKYLDFGFMVCIIMVGLAVLRPATGLDYSMNFEMFCLGLVGVIACLWRDHQIDKKRNHDKDEESNHLVDTYYQMQRYRKDRRNRE